MQEIIQSKVAAPLSISTAANNFLETFAKELDIPDSRYEQAERRYKSVGQWLCREGSTLRYAKPKVHIQGSFALGTVIRPVLEEEDYDVDMVAEFEMELSKLTQKQLKDALTTEMAAYAKQYSMEKPEPHRRCLRLNYADGAQFHMDVTPAVPNGSVNTMVLSSQGKINEWSNLSVAITDEKHWTFNVINPNWPVSNPRGYLKWFQSRMAIVFQQRRQALALQRKKRVEEIPDYQVKTPLQTAIQILKRHRDMTHDGEPCDKPISIIITTLAALAYNGEPTVSAALYGILDRMESFIKKGSNAVTIENPTNPNENFADKWKDSGEREKAFYNWRDKAKFDFKVILENTDLESIGEVMSPLLGSRLVEKAVNAANKNNSRGLVKKLWTLSTPDHKQLPLWPQAAKGTVKIGVAQFMPKKGGFRWQPIQSGGAGLPKDSSLQFEAFTTVPEPYQVFWQVVNTGAEADRANALRGGFDEGYIENGKLKRRESTLYRGTHTIECFIVKDDLCAAASGPFIINIQ